MRAETHPSISESISEILVMIHVWSRVDVGPLFEAPETTSRLFVRSEERARA